MRYHHQQMSIHHMPSIISMTVPKDKIRDVIGKVEQQLDQSQRSLELKLISMMMVLLRLHLWIKNQD